MARDGVAVDAVLAAAVARYAGGEGFSVSARCAELGVSRQTFYKYLHRFRAEGVEGFFPRSRRPRAQPSAVAASVEEAVVLARKRLADAGLDNGASSIRWWLVDHPEQWQPSAAALGVPSRATINRVLDRRGMLVRHPRRRPRRTRRRFARSARNDLWQMDGYALALAGAGRAVVIEILDDHTRLMLACHAAPSENATDAWAAFSTAAGRYGLPRQLLTDNGRAFNGHRRGFTTDLEAAVSELGVAPISSSVAHPQTCGKSERGHATARRWLASRPRPHDLSELAALLETYRGIYNRRRHQALHGLTPEQAWAIAPASGPYGAPLAAPLHVSTPRISPAGCIGLDNTEISIGRRYKDHTATAFRSGDHVAVFVDATLVRELTLERTRRYQPQP